MLCRLSVFVATQILTTPCESSTNFLTLCKPPSVSNIYTIWKKRRRDAPLSFLNFSLSTETRVATDDFQTLNELFFFSFVFPFLVFFLIVDYDTLSHYRYEVPYQLMNSRELSSFIALGSRYTHKKLCASTIISIILYPCHGVL